MDEKKNQRKKHSKHNFSDLLLDRYSYDNWFDKPDVKELIDLLVSDERVSATAPLEGGQKV